MGSNRDMGGQIKGGEGISFAEMGFPAANVMADAESQRKCNALLGTPATDGVLFSDDGMKYVVDRSSDAFWRIDHENKFTYINAAIEKITGGFRHEDLVGRSFLEFLTPEGIEQLKRIQRSQQRDEIRGIKTGVIDSELQVRRKDGTYFWAGICASPLRDSNGEITGYQGVLKDVNPLRAYETEQRRLETLLRKTKKLASLGKMTGVVAHEVNNVMAAILGFSELLMLQSDPGLEITQTHLRNIISSAERIVAILQDVMILSHKDDSGPRSVDLNELITSFLSKPDFKKLTELPTGVSIYLDLEPSLHEIMVSFSHLEKALMNLLTVSFLQAGPGGSVSVSTKTVYLGRPADGAENIHEGEYIVLSISDTGDGIADDDICRIFEPFYVRNTMKNNSTGLELAIAREVIKDHNGFIDISSRIGCGSTFTVYLPVLRDERATGRYLTPEIDYADRQTGIH